MSNYENLSGLDKAAIIFQVYGESLALSFFTELPEEAIMYVKDFIVDNPNLRTHFDDRIGS